MSNELDNNNNYKPGYFTNVGVYDHIKINIEQSSKGARVIVTYDRSDHDMIEAVNNAVKLYGATIQELKNNNLKVDESA